jgi:hypothetical protein
VLWTIKILNRLEQALGAYDGIEFLKKNINRLNLAWAFEWCMNYHCKANFLKRFFGLEPILGKKLTKIFCPTKCDNSAF